MGKVQSDNKLLGTLAGFYSEKVHTDKTYVIQHTKNKPLVLVRVVVNTSSASVVTLRDLGDAEDGGTHGPEVIANLKASVAEGTYHYSLPINGDLEIQNPGGSDLTIVFSN
jgi:hypothetical protein